MSSFSVESSQFQSQDQTVTTDYAGPPQSDSHSNLVSFLSLVQELKVDLVPFVWNELDYVGRGATANVSQATVDMGMEFAYKRTSRLFAEDPAKAFRAAMSEVRALANPSLRKHPNLVTLDGVCWEFDELERLMPVLVFPKAHYGNLNQHLSLLERDGNSFGARRDLCLDIGKAIAVLHSANIVHGDIKPGNILVFRDDNGRPTAKMIDFGHCCLGLTENDVVRIPLTRPWCAPERLLYSRFKTKDAKKTDIYSYGMVCLYTLFWNHFPKGLSSLSTSSDIDAGEEASESRMLDKVEKLLQEETGLNEELKTSLRIFFQSTLSEHPDSREVNIGTLLQYLFGSAGFPELEVFPITNNDVFVHANFRVADAAYMLSYFEYRVRRQIAKMLEDQTSACDRTKTETCTVCQSNAAFQLAFCYMIGFGVEPDNSKALTLLKTGKRSMHDVENEIEYLRETFPNTFRSSVMHELRSRQSFNFFDLSAQYQDRVGLRRAISNYRNEISALERSLGNHPVVRVLKTVLIQALQLHADFRGVEHEEEALITAMEEKFGPDYIDIFIAKANIASCYLTQGRWKEAQELYEHQLRKLQALFDKSHPIIQSVEMGLAVAYRYQDRLEEAEKFQTDILETRRQSLGSEHPDTLEIMEDLVATYSQGERWKKAEELQFQAMQSRKKVQGPMHPHTLKSIFSLAQLLVKQVRWTETNELLEQEVVTIKSVLEPEHPSTLDCMEQLASVYHIQKRWKDSEKLRREVLDARKRILGHQHQKTLCSLVDLGRTLNALNRRREAVELLEQAMRDMKIVLGPEHPETLECMEALALTYVAEGKFTEGEELKIEVIELRQKITEKGFHFVSYTIALISTYVRQCRWSEADASRLKLKYIHQSLGETHPITLLSKTGLAAMYRIQCKWKESETLLRTTMETAKRVFGEEDITTLACQVELGLTLSGEGVRLDEAAKIEEKVLSTRKQLLGEEHPDTLVIMGNLASTYSKQGGRLKEVEELESKVKEGRERLLGGEHPDTLSSMANLAATYFDQGKWREAEKLGVETLETRKRVLGEEHPDTLMSMANLASAYSSQGRNLREAEMMEKHVVEARKRLLGERHPDTLASMSNLAMTYAGEGKWGEAERLGTLVMETSRSILGEENPNTLTYIANLGSVYSQQKEKVGEGETLERHVIETRKRVLGHDHPDTLSIMASYATTCIRQDRLEEAETFYREAWDASKRVLGEEHPATLNYKANVASLVSNNDDGVEEAAILLTELIEANKRILGRDHPDTLANMSNLATILWNLGERKESEALDIRVMEARRRVLGRDHLDTLKSMYNVAFSLYSQKQTQAAVTMMEEVAVSRSRILGTGHEDTTDAEDALAMWRREVE